MPRRQLSEYRSKVMVNAALGFEYVGWSVYDTHDLKAIGVYDRYVVKVDQAVKGRFKKGLVILDVKPEKLAVITRKLLKQGYTSLLVEPYVTHDAASERYFSISQERAGIVINYSPNGGIDVEANRASIQSFGINDLAVVSKKTGFTTKQLNSIFVMFRNNHFVFLEINPYIYSSRKAIILDVAVEVDDAGEKYSEGWSKKDIRQPKTTISLAEEVVSDLNASSASSFSLSVLNEHGSMFLLLSGGGASIVVADEIHNAGKGNDIANYGEYSGNPTSDETYLYAKQILELIIASDSPQKALFIGGAVANFTDIAKTFDGIIRALYDYRDVLSSQPLTVYIRRGGPNQAKGLENIRLALKKQNLKSEIYDSSTPISVVVGRMIEGFTS
jgi:succinyl-CoA synthetase beta subunit